MATPIGLTESKNKDAFIKQYGLPADTVIEEMPIRQRGNYDIVDRTYDFNLGVGLDLFHNFWVEIVNDVRPNIGLISMDVTGIILDLYEFKYWHTDDVIVETRDDGIVMKFQLDFWFRNFATPIWSASYPFGQRRISIAMPEVRQIILSRTDTSIPHTIHDGILGTRNLTERGAFSGLNQKIEVHRKAMLFDTVDRLVFGSGIITNLRIYCERPINEVIRFINVSYNGETKVHDMRGVRGNQYLINGVFRGWLLNPTIVRITDDPVIFTWKKYELLRLTDEFVIKYY